MEKKMKKRVLLGMSGGVDSSVSAILLQEQGFEVIGITMKLFDGEIAGSCCNLESTLDAKKICDYLGIPHYTINFKQEFNKYVIEDFKSCYANCKTPNPCIECNKYLKFGTMYKKALELECDYIATGHYAKTEYDEKYGRVVLKKSNSKTKDQSYVLWNMPKEIVERVIFPLADYDNKEEIRQIARNHGLNVATKPDSEDICFIPDGNYKEFLEQKCGFKPKKGNIVNSKGEVLGEHKGLYYYTIGQRKGLGISNAVPLFVKGFDKEKNEVIVGEEKELYKKSIEVEEINLLSIDEIKNPIEVTVKTRYSQKEAKATIIQQESIIRVDFEEPQRAVTPGQSAVFYVDDTVIGGGKIK